LKDISQTDRILPTERNLRPTMRCVVLQKQNKTKTKKKTPNQLGRRQGFGVLNVRTVCVLRAASRLTTPSSAIKVKSIAFL
jgi:hypothetical protein